MVDFKSNAVSLFFEIDTSVDQQEWLVPLKN